MKSSKAEERKGAMERKNEHGWLVVTTDSMGAGDGRVIRDRTACMTPAGECVRTVETNDDGEFWMRHEAPEPWSGPYTTDEMIDAFPGYEEAWQEFMFMDCGEVHTYILPENLGEPIQVAFDVSGQGPPSVDYRTPE